MKLAGSWKKHAIARLGCLFISFATLLLALLLAAESDLSPAQNVVAPISKRVATATVWPEETYQTRTANVTPSPTDPVLQNGEQPESTAAAIETPADAPTPSHGMWLNQDEIRRLPMEGDAWNHVLSAARGSSIEPEMRDQDDLSDVYLLAAALVYGRTGEPEYRQRVIDGLITAIGTEGDERKTSILAIARNVPPYVIAADLIALSENPELDRTFRAWLLKLRETTFSGDGGSYSLISCHESRPNNFGTHCGAARVAIDLYLHDKKDLDRAATVFRGWLGERSAYTGFEFGNRSWQADEDRPVGINPPDAEIDGHSVGGALPEEMRRAGKFEWPPDRTGYAWEALQGAVVQAELLHRAGYPAWEWGDQALLRAVQFLYDIEWEATGDDGWQPWLVNHVYGTSFSAPDQPRPGKNMGWTHWSHAEVREWAGLDAESE